MKVNSSLYKGIEYVQINALPEDQKDKLLKTVNPEMLIMILVDGVIIRNCLQFTDYENWFDNVYAQSSTLVIGAPAIPVEKLNVSALALKKG